MLEKQFIVNANKSETRIAILEKDLVAELFIERHKQKGLLGNIYKGVVSRVLPGMQSAFVDIGMNRAGFLFVDDLSEGDDKPIQAQLKEGQDILVQVKKESVSSKGPRLTMQLTFPGRYIVLAPHSKGASISKKITDERERNRLRSLLEENCPENVSIIARTAAVDVSDELLLQDIERTYESWIQMTAQFGGLEAPSLVYEELDFACRVLRENYSDSTIKIVVDDERTYSKLKSYLDRFIPSASAKLEHYVSHQPIFDLYGIELDIARALNHRVDLPSGGYIVIDQTEALTSFDVNTGRFVGRGSSRNTVFKTNMEAIPKIVHQIRFRNIAGIIVIDFIDMDYKEDRDKIYSLLQEELKFDREKTNVLKVNELGLVQMTRKRTRDSLQHQLSDDCTHCLGRGKIRSFQTQAFDLLRELARVHFQTKQTLLHVKVREEVMDWIFEEENDWLTQITDDFGLTIKFIPIEQNAEPLSDPAFEITT
jgi:ribonuclease G